MTGALDSYVIRGVTHNIPLIREVMSQARFKEGRITTKYLTEEFPADGFDGHQLNAEEQLQVSLAAVCVYNRQQERLGFHRNRSTRHAEDLFVQVGKHGKVLAVSPTVEKNKFIVDGKAYQIQCDWQPNSNLMKMQLDGDTPTVIMQYHGSSYLGSLKVQAFGTTYPVTVQTALEGKLSEYLPKTNAAASDRLVKAPMAGQIISVAVKEGDTVREGGELLVIEAMKMQNVLRAPRAAKVGRVISQSGTNVAAEQVLIELDFL
jgi:propionyl-CoA carboxylase alpha chain